MTFTLTQDRKATWQVERGLCPSSSHTRLLFGAVCRRVLSSMLSRPGVQDSGLQAEVLQLRAELAALRAERTAASNGHVRAIPHRHVAS